MGTTYNVRFWHTSDIDQNALKVRIDEELIRVNKLMSTYDPESELSLFNKSSSAELHPLSDDTLKVISEAVRIGALSQGALDITIGPLVNLWGFGPNARPEVIPEEETIISVKEKTGVDKLRITENGAQKLIPDMYVDLSPVAKGFGVDQVANIVREAGITNYLVEIGGEMQVSGVNIQGAQWRIAIEKPITTERSVQKIIQIGENAIATSGDYRNYYEEDGRRYSHLIDPKTGYPIQHNLASVTVIHSSCMVADGFATAISVMGKDAGLSMALENNLAVVLITKENGEFKEYTTPEFEKFIK